jgi:hypothetical protein
MSSRMGRALRTIGVAIVAFGLPIVLGGPAGLVPLAHACGEDGLIFPFQANWHFGDMGVIQLENNRLDCGPIAHTIFVRLSSDNSYYVEEGYRELSGGNYKYAAYADPVYCPHECYVDFTDVRIGSSGSYSFRVYSIGTPVCCSSAQWRLGYATDGSESNWTKLLDSEWMPTNQGRPESEISFYGSPSAWDNHSALKFRDTNDNWNLWNSIHCDDISYGDGWAGHFYSSSTWYTVQGSDDCWS